MPRTVDSTFNAEKNKAENRPVFLYTIHDYDGSSNNLYFAEWDADVVYDGITYTKFPIKHDTVSENTSGEVDSVKVTVANVDRTIEGYLEAYDLRGKKVTIKRVWADQLADPTACMNEIFYIDSYGSTEEAAEFTLSSKLAVMDTMLPTGKYFRGYCRWIYKSTECGYTGELPTCLKTLADCRAHSNQLRIGAFPAIPTQRTFIS
jgi:lambda family phage minor tail protein L